MKRFLLCCFAIMLVNTSVVTVNAADLISEDASADQVIQTETQIFATDIETGNLIAPLTSEEVCVISSDQTSMTVTKTVVFQGEVTPPATIVQSNTVSGKTYTGTLYLTSYIYYDGQTTAYYEGTLYLQGSSS